MIRGKLEVTELGITTPEADFLANFVLPEDGTVRQSSVCRHRVVAMDDDGNRRVTKSLKIMMRHTRKGIANMSWLELISSGVAAVAVAIAFVSLIVSYRADQWTQIQVLPSITVLRAWSSSGERSLHVKLEPTPDRQDWVIANAGVRRTCRNLRTWRKPSLIARGEVLEPDVLEDGTLYSRCRKVGDWDRCLTFGGGRREVAIFVQPCAPDCDIALEITLSTSPSPVAIRYAKSPRLSPSERITV